MWFYLDVQNAIQGPFSTAQMDRWAERALLFDQVRVGLMPIAKTLLPLQHLLDKDIELPYVRKLQRYSSSFA